MRWHIASVDLFPACDAEEHIMAVHLFIAIEGAGIASAAGGDRQGSARRAGY